MELYNQTRRREFDFYELIIKTTWIVAYPAGLAYLGHKAGNMSVLTSLAVGGAITVGARINYYTKVGGDLIGLAIGGAITEVPKGLFHAVTSTPKALVNGIESLVSLIPPTRKRRE